MENETIKTELTKEQQFMILDLLHNECSHITNDIEIYKENKERVKLLHSTIEQIQKTWNS